MIALHVFAEDHIGAFGGYRVAEDKSYVVIATWVDRGSL